MAVILQLEAMRVWRLLFGLLLSLCSAAAANLVVHETAFEGEGHSARLKRQVRRFGRRGSDAEEWTLNSRSFDWFHSSSSTCDEGRRRGCWGLEGAGAAADLHGPLLGGRHALLLLPHLGRLPSPGLHRQVQVRLAPSPGAMNNSLHTCAVRRAEGKIVNACHCQTLVDITYRSCFCQVPPDQIENVLAAKKAARLAEEGRDEPGNGFSLGSIYKRGVGGPHLANEEREDQTVTTTTRPRLP